MEVNTERIGAISIPGLTTLGPSELQNTGSGGGMTLGAQSKSFLRAEKRRFFRGDLAELLVFTDLLSAHESDSLLTHLSRKWLSSPPSMPPSSPPGLPPWPPAPSPPPPSPPPPAVSYYTSSGCDAVNCSLHGTLARANAAAVFGVPVVLSLANESFIVAGGGSEPFFRFGPDTRASRVVVQGSGDTKITIKGNATLFVISPDSPPVVLQGLTLHGRLAVFGGDLTLHSCRVSIAHAGNGVGSALAVSSGSVQVIDCEFVRNQGRLGGAVSLRGGSLVVEDTTFTRNQAERGGAFFASGGQASFARCSFLQNSALVSGGAIELSGTADIVLSDGSVLLGNSAAGGLSSVHRVAGSLAYVLPAPLGRWIDSSGGTTALPLASASVLDFDYPYPCAPGRELGEIQTPICPNIWDLSHRLLRVCMRSS